MELKTVNPVVFDDPEYCGDLKNFCKFEFVLYCRLFEKKDGTYEKLESNKRGRNIKCQQCKDHYQKSKKLKEVELLNLK